jgi:transposase-like protein
MASHFLLSARARTLSLAIRFANNGGAAFCPRCECTAVYTYQTRRLWKCKACSCQFSVTSGTIFASCKLPIRDYLAAIAIFVNAAKGISALQLGRDLDVQYKTAFVMAHKLREAMTAQQATGGLTGTVEVDGAYFGGHSKQANVKADRTDRRKAQNAKRQSVIVAREREGRTVAFVAANEAQGAAVIRGVVQPGATVHTDEAASWDSLHAHFEMRRINHSVAYSQDGACTNMAESFFSRLRRAEIGQHHHISGKYLGYYAAEMGWRENRRRVDNGALHALATGAALSHPKSAVWAGYWQR